MISTVKRTGQLQLGRAIGYLLVALPLLLGYLVGLLVLFIRYVAAAFMVGYEKGARRGPRQ
jgi:hypothetical protein